MPFDPTPIIRPAVSRNGVNLKAARELEDALRNELPSDWHWDFNRVRYAHSCGSAGCAIGLARHIGLVARNDSFVSVLNFSSEDWCKTFTHDGHGYGVPIHAVTPLMVADALRAIIAREEAEGGA